MKHGLEWIHTMAGFHFMAMFFSWRIETLNPMPPVVQEKIHLRRFPTAPIAARSGIGPAGMARWAGR
jgi:hypothetical protein